ncbi:MAG: DNA replication protein psf2 [Alyxoria varia]|nr:MAG: DNA replication protein psf2 [Alyxoria varia]
MAHPSLGTLSPSESAFLAELELVTVVPRQKMSGMQLLGGNIPQLRPPTRTPLPLWLALLLKRQRRADIAPPSWLSTHALTTILDRETSDLTLRDEFCDPPRLTQTTGSTGSAGGRRADNTMQTPPFQPTSLADFLNITGAEGDEPEQSLPYHWLEVSQMLLAEAADDIPESEAVRRLLRDLKEVRAAKLRRRWRTEGERNTALDSNAGIRLNGIGSMEVGEARGFLCGVVDELRRLDSSREASAREAWEEGGSGAGPGGAGDSEDEDML